MAVRPAAARRAAVFALPAGASRPRAAKAPKRRASCSRYARAAGAGRAISPPSSRRRAQKLAEAAPKLRAKGAGAALQALLDEDSLSARRRKIAGLSERGARRLFERLVALGAVRELTGRDDVPALRALSMARTRKAEGAELDLDLEDLPPPARWREWMARVEAVIFASAEPVSRETLARVVGKACNLELDHRRHPRGIARAALRNRRRRRRLELSHQARVRRRDPDRARRREDQRTVEGECGRADGDWRIFSRSRAASFRSFWGGRFRRDAIAALRGEGLIAAGPRSPTPGAPYAYVTTPGFLAQFGFESLRDLPGHREARGRGAARANWREGARWRRAGGRVARGAGFGGRRGRD